MPDAEPSPGACCPELAEALEFPGSSLHRDEDGALYLGLLAGGDAEEHLETAVRFCPFCGCRQVGAPGPA